jgi:hypothetical protein
MTKFASLKDVLQNQDLKIKPALFNELADCSLLES